MRCAAEGKRHALRLGCTARGGSCRQGLERPKTGHTMKRHLWGMLRSTSSRWGASLDCCLTQRVSRSQAGWLRGGAQAPRSVFQEALASSLLMPKIQGVDKTRGGHGLGGLVLGHRVKRDMFSCQSRKNDDKIGRFAETPTETAMMGALEKSLNSRFGEKRLIPSARPLLIVISGPSGVGKDAVINRLQEVRSDMHFVVTATTRPKRDGEEDGRDYIFTDKSHFEEMIAKGELLEHAMVYGDYKGIPKQQVRRALSKGTDVVLRLDVQGASTIRKLIPGSVSIFLVAENERALVKRLLSRKTEPLDKAILRVETAQKETQRISEFDYGK